MPRSRTRDKVILSILVTLVGGGAIGAFAICDLCQPAVEAAVATTPATQALAWPIISSVAEEEKVTLEVKGMTCGGCAIAARTVLERLDGVQRAEVSYEKSRAVVTYVPEKVTIERMIAALKELGYTATVVPE